MNKPKHSSCFFAFSNLDKNYLGNLKEERKNIKNHLEEFERARKLDINWLAGDTNIVDFVEELIRYDNKKRPLDLLHYSGHAGERYLEMADGNYFQPNFFKALEGLQPKLVFLNGCSTKGFVIDLLKCGVKAVIATSANVEDKLACTFAIQFYQSLAKQYTLKEAFGRASGTVPYYSNNLRVSFEERDANKSEVRGWGNLPENWEREPAWGLYCSEELEDFNQTGTKISIKEWKLVSDSYISLDLEGVMSALYTEIMQIKANVKEDEDKKSNIEREVDYCENEIKNNLDVLNIQTEEKVYKIIERYIESFKLEILKYKREITVLTDNINIKHARIKEINTKIEQSAKNPVKASLVEEIKDLNYIQQTDYLARHSLPHMPYAALVLQGGQRCALKLLKDIIINHLGLAHTNEMLREVYVDFESSIYTSMSIHDRVKNHFKTPSVSLEETVDHIVGLCTNGVNIVITIAFIRKMTAQQLNEIKLFWKRLAAIHGQMTPVGKLLLFILDTNCKLVLPYEGTLYTSDKDTHYQQLFADQAANAHVVPIVQQVDENTVKDWLSHKLRIYDKQGFDTKAFSKPSFMLDTIKRVCEEIEEQVVKQNLDLFNHAFARYIESEAIL